ncbi:hypothetical protein EAH_00057110 [Eimeria acervulina]|uniref:Transmembrane protein n=1 Tax=Eimeria acervulina TaxID=5801 RepID=U6G8M1_EIMAC|nr:hypothetical protein EAH_00057110 [Eimeria acervulina]CDI76576.1 hypothetical protein EAH_00057110 [Eimeria acervulina]
MMKQPTPASAFHTPGEAEDPGSPVGAPFEDYLRLRPVGKLRRTRHHRRLVTVALISIVSLMAVASWIALCYTHRNRTNTAGLVKRSLSDLGDQEELSEILEQCVELEAELGISGTALSTSGEGVNVSAIYESAAKFEEARGMQHQMVKGDASWLLHGFGSFAESLSQATYLSGIDQHMAEGSLRGRRWNHSYGGAVSSAGMQNAPYSATGEFPSVFPPLTQEQGHVPLTEEHQQLQASPMGVPLPYGDGSASQAHMQDFSALGAASNLLGISPEASVSQGYLAGSPPAGADSMFEARASGEQDGFLRGGAEAEGTFGFVSATTQQESKREGEQPAQRVQVLEDSQEPSSSAGAVAPTSALCNKAEEIGQLTHPYVRLPLVNPKDIPRPFRTEIAFSTTVFERSSLQVFVRMRKLLSKNSLSTWEVEALLRQCEYLVNHALHKLTAPPPKPGAFFVARRLGILFFTFDYVVCTIMLLQEKMETRKWWDMFVSKFSTEYHFPDSYVGKRDLDRKLPDLVNRLSQALSVYKQALRPPADDVIALKKDVLRLLRNYGYFQHQLWGLWRKDDARFRCRGAETSKSE